MAMIGGCLIGPYHQAMISDGLIIVDFELVF